MVLGDTCLRTPRPIASAVVGRIAEVHRLNGDRVIQWNPSNQDTNGTEGGCVCVCVCVCVVCVCVCVCVVCWQTGSVSTTTIMSSGLK